MNKLILIDGSSIMYRAFFALPHFVTKNNEPTGALYGFVRMLLRILKDEKPQYLAVAFDRRAPTKRHMQYKEYKAQRPPMPDELSPQFAAIHELLEALNVKVYEMDGYEADDIIGALAKYGEKNEFLTVVISGDMDLTQLISEKIKIKVTRKGVTNLEEIDRERLKETLGIYPEQIPDFKALTGDPSDNIPGLPGIGPKTAAKLLSEYGSIEEILLHTGEIKKGGLVEEYKGRLISGKELCTLMLDVPIDFNIDEMKLSGFDEEKLKGILSRFEFTSLLNELGINLNNKNTHIETDDRIGLYIEAKNGQVQHFAAATQKNVEEFNIGEELFANTKALKILKDLLENDKKKEILNLKELHKVACHYGVKLSNIHLDLAVAGHLLNPNIRNYSIKELCDAFSVPFGGESLSEHAKQLLQLSYIEDKELEERGLMELYNDIEKPLSEILADMEITGKQLAAVLFDNLGLNPSKMGKTGYSTSSAVLADLVPEHPIISLVLEYRSLSKLYSGYIIALPKLVSKEGFRLHTTFHQLGTITGRLRSSKPNLQNIPIRTDWGEKIRAGFVASEGHFLLSADYSQIELRILAHLSKDKNLINAFMNGADIHTRTASLVFNVKDEEVTKEMRRSAKILNFGIVYGMSSYGAAKQLGCSANEAKEYIDRYFARFPTVQEFLEELVESAIKSGEARTIFGRRRKIPGMDTGVGRARDEARRFAINTPIQGSAADIIKIAMVKVFNRIKDSGDHIVLQIHDELVLEVGSERIEKVKQIVKEEMESAFPLSVPLVVNIAYGNNLREAKG
jgi:DNA polymerase-1